MSMTMDNVGLAVHGGPKAVTVEPRENWPVPVDEIEAAVVDLVRRNVYSGDWQQTYFPFEKAFAEYVGAKYCVAQNNGTSTLAAAYFAAGVGPGDEVIHPAFTWVCSISPAVHLGAKPVFCEIDPKTLVIDPIDVERRITPRTRAITAVHLHGNVCDMDALMEIARKHNVFIIEDCSHSHGAEWDGKKVGTIGHVGCFSMQGDALTGKPVPAGEGGILTTNDSHLFDRVLAYCHLNRPGVVDQMADPTYKALGETVLGLKFRAHPFALAVAGVWLKSLDDRNAKKAAYRQKIYDALADVPGLYPVDTPAKARPAGFYGGMYMLYEPSELGGLPVGEFVEALRAEGVDTHHRGYGVTHLYPWFAKGFDMYDGRGIAQPMWGDYAGYQPGSLPVSEETILNRIVGMPTFIEETPGYSDQVIDALQKVASHYAKAR